MPEVTVFGRERAAEGEHPLPDAERVGVAEGEGREVVAVHAEHGEVGEGVGPDHLGVELAAVEEHHAELVGPLDHVVVGDDVAVGGHEGAAAEPALGAVATERRQPERVVLRARRRQPGRLDLDDGRVHALGDGRERLAQVLGRGDGLGLGELALGVGLAEQAREASQVGSGGHEDDAADHGGDDEEDNGRGALGRGHESGGGSGRPWRASPAARSQRRLARRGARGGRAESKGLLKKPGRPLRGAPVKACVTHTTAGGSSPITGPFPRSYAGTEKRLSR